MILRHYKLKEILGKPKTCLASGSLLISSIWLYFLFLNQWPDHHLGLKHCPVATEWEICSCSLKFLCINAYWLPWKWNNKIVYFREKCNLRYHTLNLNEKFHNQLLRPFTNIMPPASTTPMKILEQKILEQCDHSTKKGGKLQKREAEGKHIICINKSKLQIQTPKASADSKNAKKGAGDRRDSKSLILHMADLTSIPSTWACQKWSLSVE